MDKPCETDLSGVGVGRAAAVEGLRVPLQTSEALSTVAACALMLKRIAPS